MTRPINRLNCTHVGYWKHLVAWNTQLRKAGSWSIRMTTQCGDRRKVQTEEIRDVKNVES